MLETPRLLLRRWRGADRLPSQAVMRRLGMTCEPVDDFEHPSLPVGHRLRTHVVHRLRRS